MKKTILTDKDYTNFYKAVLYGKIDDPLQSSIHAAYRDLCRTISGFAKNPKHDQIYANCCEVIYDEVNKIKKMNINQNDMFDKIHYMFCDRLVLFSEGVLTFGQAQKWINMTFKYLSMFNHESIESIYEYLHIPIDNYILKATKYKISTAWSKMNDYNEYLSFQKWFRNKYNGIPLDVEFNMWLKEGKGIDE